MATDKLRRAMATQLLDISNSYNETKVGPDFPVWDVLVCEYVRRLVAERVI